MPRDLLIACWGPECVGTAWLPALLRYVGYPLLEVTVMRPFARALLDSVLFLQGLCRTRASVPETRARFELFRKQHSNVRCDLLIHQPPGSPWVDYDIYLGLPDGDTLAVALHRDSGLPWAVEYADHWAANFIVTVNGSSTTIQSALLFTKFAFQREPDLMEALINQHLIEQTLEHTPVHVSPRELQAAADAFRRRNGLHTADATRQWLKELGLSTEAFDDIIRRMVRAEKLKTLICKDRLNSYFKQHRREFDLVRFIYLDSPDRSPLKRILRGRQHSSLMAAAEKLSAGPQGTHLQCALRISFRRELPDVLVPLSPGEVAGPIAYDKGFWTAQVLECRCARLDAQTVKKLQDVVFQEWLSERREESTVQWHWVL